MTGIDSYLNVTKSPGDAVDSAFEACEEPTLPMRDALARVFGLAFECPDHPAATDSMKWRTGAQGGGTGTVPLRVSIAMPATLPPRSPQHKVRSTPKP